MGDTAPRRIHAFVSGRVQGVYYRASTAQECRSLALSGWVRNLSDGRVELEAEGPDASVARLVEWLHDGPQAARVGGVEVSEVAPRGAAGPFEIRR